MTEEYQLRVLPQVAYNENNMKAYLAKEKGLDERTIYRVRVLKRSIDARHHKMIDAIITDPHDREMLFNKVDSLFEQLHSIYYGVYFVPSEPLAFIFIQLSAGFTALFSMQSLTSRGQIIMPPSSSTSSMSARR